MKTRLLTRYVGSASCICVLLPAIALAIAPEVRDEGKFFTQDAVRKANRAVREISRKYERDLLIDTVAKIPGDDAERVKAMNSAERAKFFHNWAVDRSEAAVVRGVYILICRDPATLSVHITDEGKKFIDSREHEQLREILIREFRDKKYDEGLQKAVDFVRAKLDAKARLGGKNSSQTSHD